MLACLSAILWLLQGCEHMHVLFCAAAVNAAVDAAAALAAVTYSHSSAEPTCRTVSSFHHGMFCCIKCEVTVYMRHQGISIGISRWRRAAGGLLVPPLHGEASGVRL
jgi:hypothetical protein